MPWKRKTVVGIWRHEVREVAQQSFFGTKGFRACLQLLYLLIGDAFTKKGNSSKLESKLEGITLGKK
jgi:hypothetical protein